MLFASINPYTYFLFKINLTIYFAGFDASSALWSNFIAPMELCFVRNP